MLLVEVGECMVGPEPSQTEPGTAEIGLDLTTRDAPERLTLGFFQSRIHLSGTSEMSFPYKSSTCAHCGQILSYLPKYPWSQISDHP